MLLRLLLLFTVVPLVELVLLLWFRQLTSFTATIALVLTTGIVGAILARRQGWQAWRRIQECVARGEPPTDPLVDGLLILIAGAVLITPGILTDLFGFALLVPPLRAALKRWLGRKLKTRAVMQFQQFHATGTTGFDDDVIDAEFTRHPSDQ